MTSGIGRHIATTGAGAVAERTGNVQTVATLQSTTSTTFTDLLTVGPAATVTCGIQALVIIGASMLNTSAGLGARVSVALSGANTVAASDVNSVLCESGNPSDTYQFSWLTVMSPITAGSTTFTLKYRAVGGGTATYSSRTVAVVPF